MIEDEFKAMGTNCPVTFFAPEDRTVITAKGETGPQGIAIHHQTMPGGVDVLFITITHPDHGLMLAMLDFEAFNSFCHSAADLIEAANAQDRPASMGTMQ